MNFLLLWHTYGDFLLGPGGLAAGWYGRLAATRAQTRRDRLDAGSQALTLAGILAAREQDQAAAVEALRRREWVLAGSVQDVYAEAIAARLIIYDLDATAGRPVRQFRPLPPYPFPAQGNDPAAGATVADTAEPGGDNH
ncbi:hypothetical protein NKW54_05490 [Acetobacter cerevisiae]|uniref:Uncharacterized protein n=1 Tax=Acetobacter cerevisiae TaxID=178900 RepID=A0A149UY73_9PROT|nr:hypothetical protein [Acetobacter cerevisiae]KXV72858.1 hypothetical protein AD952_01770 [Acetobacter cerevisiae]MCP1245394.1 hypothetical protein [Acetobacter cerevisiae]MCP1256950.1 hypothetical protein [Acetobacter cerevisiae]